MASWDGKTKGGLLGYKIFVLILKYLNVKVAYFILNFVVFYYFLFADKKGIFFYFRQIHGYGKFKTYLSIYRNFCSFGQVLIDKMTILSGFSSKYSFNFEGENYIHEMAKNKTGGVLLGAHVGNWEIAGQLLEKINCKVNFVMYDGERTAIKDYLDSIMQNKNIEAIFISDNDYSYLHKIELAFKKKEIIAMHGDRFLPGSKNTITCNFLGYPAVFPTGPLYLASKYGTPVTCVFAMKETLTHYHLYATKPKIFKYPSKLSTRKSELKIMVQDYVNDLESILKKYPLQWYNYYQLWKIE